jgi:hypothetical protein
VEKVKYELGGFNRSSLKAILGKNNLSKFRIDLILSIIWFSPDELNFINQ